MTEIDVTRFIGGESDPENRCLRRLEKEPGLPMGEMMKTLQRQQGVTKERAGEVLQGMIEKGSIKATEHRHSRTDKPFLRFWPAE